MVLLIRFTQRVVLISSLLLLFSLCFASNPSANLSKANKSQFVIQQDHSTELSHHLSREEIAGLLDWMPSGDVCNLCSGYYQEPSILIQNKVPLPLNKLPTQITADGPTLFESDGISILQDNIVVTQPGRIIKADKAYIYRDGKTGKIDWIRLEGNVHLLEYGKHDVADWAIMNLRTNNIDLHDNIYHVAESEIPELRSNKKLTYDAWGRARRLVRDANTKIIQLWHATYTTCSPLGSAWELGASHIILNKETGRGYAYNSVLKVQKVPIFYYPYISFPINNERKSGFLMPTPAYSSINGFELEIPYYWNIAPNYDLTITPELMANRGIITDSNFRYLTIHNSGNIDVSFIPDDQIFAQFRRTELATVKVTPITEPYLRVLNKADDNRAFISIHDDGKYGERWISQVNINYATDPYYFNDFDNTQYSGVINQLLNMADLQYNGSHWQWIGLVQAYQTLHLITLPSVSNQYIRLPEIDAKGEYPNLPLDLDLHMNGQAVNFLYDSEFPPYTFQRPVGQRFHWISSLSRAFYRSFGFLIPQISLDTTQYFATMAVINDKIPQPQFEGNRNIPIFNIDSGLYFDRSFLWNDYPYIQTFEPRLFYLYVPYQNQNEFPIFDTLLLPFSFDQLFALNRFTGYDRIENANQVSMALTSRILDGEGGDPLLETDLGIIRYLQQPQVPLFNPVNPKHPILPDVGDWSPAVAQISYTPWVHWSAKGSLAWDVTRNEVNNTQIGLTYRRDVTHILNFEYEYVPKITNTSLNTFGLNNTNLISIGATWPITHSWSVLSYWFYNLNQDRPENYYTGLQYSTCCWAVRFLVDKQYRGTNPITTKNTRPQNQFNTTYFVQIMLKGLTDLGTNDPSTLLQSTLPGYQDPFKGHF